MQRTLLCVSVLLLFPTVAIRAQAQTTTVWSGVYTAEQAARGKAAYEADCTGCHGPYLEGFRSTGSAKALARDPFMDRWDGAPLDELYEFIRTMMPKANPDKVSDTAKLDILTYILQVNGFPAGSSSLAASGLAAIRMQSKEGIRPLKNGMTVQAVGCITQADGKWLLTRATEPTRARNDALSTGAELTANAKKSGTGTVALVDAYPEPTEFKGQKVEVKGMFVAGQTPAINLLGFQKVAETCD